MLNEMTAVKDGYIIFTGTMIEMYIPESYKESNLMEEMGDRTKVFGLFNCRMFDKNDKGGKIETFNIPSMISLEAPVSEKKSLSLAKGSEEESYNIIRFYNGDPITRAEFQQDSSNVELFIKILTGGKIPKTIPYNQIIQIWQENLRMNHVHLNVASIILELIIAEVYRDKSNPQNKFAKKIGKVTDGDEYDYKTANIREITSLNSVFAALTFEDMDQMITSSLNMTKYNKKQTTSPVEKIIKM